MAFSENYVGNNMKETLYMTNLSVGGPCQLVYSKKVFKRRKNH